MRRVAAQALRLRAWALSVLSGGPATPPPAARPEAWRLFLQAERCAHPLRQALSAARVLDGVDEVARGALERKGVAEAMNALAARQEAASVSKVLAAGGWTGIVLKGGAAVLAGACEVDLVDLDVLVRPEHAQPFADRLDATGYRRGGVDVGPDDPNGHEMAARFREGSIVVEVHFDLAPKLEGDLWAGAVPLPFPSLFRLAPADNLWHVLIHGTLHHPDRRGVLRDLVVAAAGVRWCSTADLDEVERRCAAHPQGGLAARMLAMARGMAEGRGEDAFAREAATGYLLRLYIERHAVSHARWLALSRTVFALGERDGEYGRLWYGSPESVIFRGYSGHSALDRRLPVAGAVVRSGWRAVNMVAALAPATWIARTAKALEEEASAAA